MTILVLVDRGLPILRRVEGAAKITPKECRRTRGPGAQRRGVTVIHARIARRARRVSTTDALETRKPLTGGRGLFG